MTTTTLGYGLGAKVIYCALQSLAERGIDGTGIVCDVILLGAAVPANEIGWNCVRKVASGRVVNGFSSNDWVLGVLCRTETDLNSVAGMYPVTCQSGVENIDLSDIVVNGHREYQTKMRQIFNEIGFIA